MVLDASGSGSLQLPALPSSCLSPVSYKRAVPPLIPICGHGVYTRSREVAAGVWVCSFYFLLSLGQNHVLGLPRYRKASWEIPYLTAAS